MLNAAINKLPFELHIPGYRFCGPGTKLEERLARGDKGINGLDEACKNHDIAYSQSKDIKDRHEADKILANQAFKQFHSKNSRWTEKMAALGVAGAMKAKVKLGMGLRINYKSMMTKCAREIKKLKKSVERNLDNINYCLTILENNKSSSSISNKTPIKKQSQKKLVNLKKRKCPKKQINMDVDISDDYPMIQKDIVTSHPPPPQSSSITFKKRKYKRKLNNDHDGDNDNDDELSISTNKKSRRTIEDFSEVEEAANSVNGSVGGGKKRKRDLLEDNNDDSIDVHIGDEYKKKKSRKL